MWVEGCYCDKIMGDTADSYACICNQRCYVPSPCVVCGPEGCADTVSRQAAQEKLAAAINKAMAKAGASDREVDPQTLMNPRYYGKRGHGGMKTRKKS